MRLIIIFLLIVLLYYNRAYFLSNEARETLILDLPPEKAYAIVQRQAKEMPGWTIVSEKRFTLEATATTPVFGFVDDIIIRVRPKDHGSEIEMFSKSRVGKGDLGTNSRRIHHFFEKLKDRKNTHDNFSDG